MPTVDENRACWSAWTTSGAEWSREWGSVEQEWAHTFYSRIAAFLPARSILEIATGYGRWTRFLLQHCEQFYGIDLVENCIAACRERFGGTTVQFLLTDGKTIPATVPANSIDFVFSADSLVHADAHVIGSYLKEIRRVMSNDAIGFLHHSNFGALPKSTPNLRWRDASMSAELFRTQCRAAGLFCLSQELIGWGQGDLNDCFSLIAKQQLYDARITINRDFAKELDYSRRLALIYHPHPLPKPATEARPRTALAHSLLSRTTRKLRSFFVL